MTAIREVGKINNDTTLIDVTMLGVPKITAIYLVESDGKKCLIDGGTKTEARHILKQLEKFNAFPPDMIIITHSHWDHTQAIPRIRKKAAQMGKKVEVMASQTAIPLLKDQSWNEVFGGNFDNIEDVTPLTDGQKINLGEISLKIFDMPGHMKDHIAILDEKNKNIFVGDMLGYKVTDQIFVPGFMPPYNNKQSFLQSIEKLRKIDYKSICLAHFGCFINEEAKTILDEAISAWNTWWDLFEKHEDKLNDLDAMVTLISENILSKSATEDFGTALVGAVVGWLISGFKMARKV